MKDEMNLSEMLFNRDERLLDYITNLQKENKILKEQNVCVGCNNNPDYKSRIDKAINLLNNEDIVVKLQEFENKYTVNFYDKKVELLNILNGGDDNE